MFVVRSTLFEPTGMIKRFIDYHLKFVDIVIENGFKDTYCI